MEEKFVKEGRKIFLLYPPSAIRDELLDSLLMEGFEAYILRDHQRALKLLAIFPDSIMYINIDEGQSEPEWETYIKGITGSPQTKDCLLGILSHTIDLKLMKKCLVELSLRGGFIQFKFGMMMATKIMFAALETHGAKGRRKCVRTACGNDPTATVNVKGSHSFYNGHILDISAVGISARFEKFEDALTHSRIKDMQLKLQGRRVLTDAVCMGKRSEDVYIFLFDVHRMNPDHKLLIHRFIKNNMQKFLDNLQI